MMETICNPRVNGGKPVPLITMGEKLPPGFMETYFPNWPTLGDLYRAGLLGEKTGGDAE